MTPIIEFKNYTFKYRSQSEPTLIDKDEAAILVKAEESQSRREGFNRGTVRVGKIDSGALHQRDGSFFIPWRKQRNFDCGR